MFQNCHTVDDAQEKGILQFTLQPLELATRVLGSKSARNNNAVDFLARTPSDLIRCLSLSSSHHAMQCPPPPPALKSEPPSPPL